MGCRSGLARTAFEIRHGDDLEVLITCPVTQVVRFCLGQVIGLMFYSFARIGASLAMKVENIYVQNRRLWVRLHEKGGKRHEMPCHHNLETYLHAYTDLRQFEKLSR